MDTTSDTTSTRDNTTLTSESMSSLDEQVFAAVSRADKGISRADLVDATDLPRSSVNYSVRRLIGIGDIEEYKMAGSTGGRRAALLRAVLKRDLAYVAELGTKHARIGISDMSGTLIAATDVPITISTPQEEILDLLHTTWRELRDEHVPHRNITAIGVAVPGPVDNAGIVTGAARMPGWNRSDFRSMLAEKIRLPAYIENDARAGAIGEWSGRASKTGSMLYIKAGSGIGAAWIIDGVPYRGSNGFAGEITHTRISTDSPIPCSCGNNGCLETVASGTAILRRLRDTDLDITTVKQLITAAENGDYPVVPLVREAGLRIGEVVSGLVNFLNPQNVIIGGSLSQIDALIAGVRSELYRRCLPMSTSELTVETSLTGQDAPLAGMAILARERTFR